MTHDEVEAMLRDLRPEPPPGLRERVLAAAAQIEPRPRWWARVSTWSAAAATLLLGNWLLMSCGGAPTLPSRSHPAVSLSLPEAAELPPLLVAWLQLPPPPVHGNAPTPRTPLSEILQ